MQTHTRPLWRFDGGVRLEPHKQISTATPIGHTPIPARLYVPMGQPTGEAARPVIEIGERVRKGQPIGASQAELSAAVHAPTSGTVTAIEAHAVPHPDGLSATCVVIDTDGLDEWDEPPLSASDHRRLSPASLRDHIRQSGIVGLGGAAFPASIKLQALAGQAIETLIINGVECEPYITCDDMLMREHPGELLGGARILRDMLGARACVIAIEADMPQAFAAMTAAVKASGFADIEVIEVPAIYPAGGEKQLIRILTGREVPSGGLPADIGVLCQNAGTAHAVHQAMVRGEPLISRIVTVTGPGITRPRNLRVMLGTPITDLIAACGGYTPDADRLMIGGPMMGFALPNDDYPVTKGTNCILVTPQAERPAADPPMPCIRCMACVQVCPARLLPQELYWHARAGDLDQALGYNLFDCIECGCCSHVCPSRLPLVQHYRQAKATVRARERERQDAQAARRRFEAHEARKTREAREQAEQQARQKAALEDKQGAIQAAVQRAKAKRNPR